MIPADLAPLIHQGDALELARKMPSESVQVIVTSPPYWRMRDYGVEGQWGLENTVEEYVNRLVVLFRELRRVLRKDGTAWVNIGDTYVGGGHGSRGTTSSVENGDRSKVVDSPKPSHGLGRDMEERDFPGRTGRPGGSLKRKDLALVPFRLAIGLQDDGWWVREAIIWSKPNGIPEPARGRPVHSHEYILLLARSEKYFYDGFAVRQPGAEVTASRYESARRNSYTFDSEVHKIPVGHGGVEMMARVAKADNYDGMSNLRSVWSIAMEPYAGEHFAPFPSEIPRRAILAGTSARGACAACGAPWRRKTEAEGGMIGHDLWPENREGRGHAQGSLSKRIADFKESTDRGPLIEGKSKLVGVKPGEYVQRDLGFEPGCACGAGVAPCVVLDPFAGSGTTLQVARELGRQSVGFELNPAYHKISKSRPGVGLPDILSWTEESHARTVEDILGPETVTPRPRLPVVTLDAWE